MKVHKTTHQKEVKVTVTKQSITFTEQEVSDIIRAHLKANGHEPIRVELVAKMHYWQDDWGMNRGSFPVFDKAVAVMSETKEARHEE